MIGRQRALLYVGLLALGCCACNPAHQAVRPSDITPKAVPKSFSKSTRADPPGGDWWIQLGSTELTALIQDASLDNLDIQQARARIEQAQAIVGIAGSARRPTVDASFSATRSRNPFIPVGPPVVVDQLGVSIGAAYELDVWDRLGATQRAAEYDRRAAQLDQHALLMSVTAQIAETWLLLIEQRATKQLIDAQVETNKTLLQLVQVRFGNGLAQAADVLRQQQQVLATRSLLPSIDAQRKTLEHQLAILVGQAPSEGKKLAGKTVKMPPLSPLPKTGLPSDLLARRPDIAAARIRVSAADERIGAAIADRFPAFRIQASTGFGATSFAELLDRWLWSLTGSLVAPLFDGGRRAAEVERTRAVLDGLTAAFQGLFLNAIREVEDALVLEFHETERIERLTAELTAGQKLLEESRARYLEGLGDYLAVITAVQAMQRTERTLLASQRQRLSHRIRLHRALGGTWAGHLDQQGQVGVHP
ncbi:MAG: efflux transporter outer membrane subunit [Myxococcota bacterium]|nr:efflux transporter outer membrane subunit [Myxococcota bacterium]